MQRSPTTLLCGPTTGHRITQVFTAIRCANRATRPVLAVGLDRVMRSGLLHIQKFSRRRGRR